MSTEDTVVIVTCNLGIHILVGGKSCSITVATPVAIFVFPSSIIIVSIQGRIVNSVNIDTFYYYYYV